MLQVCAPPPIKIFWVMFNFLRSCQTVSKSGCTILFFYQHALRVSFSLRVSRHLLLFVSLIISVLVGVKCYLVVGFFLFFCFFCFLGPHSRHMEVPRLGVKSELQLPTYATSHSNVGSEPLLRRTSQHVATPGP